MKKLIPILLLLAMPLAAQEPQAPSPDTAAEDFAKAIYFGKKFFELKEYTSAYDQYAKADALRPEQPAVLYNMALLLAKAGRYSEAQVKVDHYLQLFPNGTERPLVTKLQLELEFQRELQKKRQADRDYLDLFSRATYLYGRNELAEALASFQRAESLRPTDPAAVFNQAMVLEKQGELAKAVERYRRFQELERDPEQKAGVDQRVFALENELQDMRTKIVCPFCGHKLEQGSTWCHRCWHGPYLVKSPLWNSRPCIEGASATRSTFYSEDRFAKNDALPCLTEGTMLESLRYTPSRQRAIQDARKSEGWRYTGDVIQGWRDDIRYAQGPEYLERVTSQSGGDILSYVAHRAGEGFFLLDREDLVIDAQKYTTRYTFDANGRIAQQRVDYQNAAACNHLVSMTADYAYDNDALTQIALKGGYTGFPAEGSPKTDWAATVTYAYDDKARVAKEELAVTSFNKIYDQRPFGDLRDDVAKFYMGMRPKRPIENLVRTGDLCATSGTLMLGNLIDLRPFYAMSPNLAMALPRGVAKAVVNFTYPDAYRAQ